MRELIENHRQAVLMVALAVILLLTALAIVAAQTVDAGSFVGDINNPPGQSDDSGTW